MRIDPQNQTAGSSETSRVNDPQSGQVKGSQRPASNAPTDTVQLSPGPATVRQLVTQLDQVPDIRQEQVNSLSSAIGTGRYRPSDVQVAAALAAQSFGISELA